jgi:hypothetical protein
MNTTRRIVVALWLLTLFSFSCTTSHKSEIDREAEREAQEWWDKTVAKCGEDYYLFNEWIEMDNLRSARVESDIKKKALFQFKNADLNLRPSPVIEADRLNGYEWKGRAEVMASSYRRYDEKSGRWESWSEGVPKFPNPMTGERNTLGIYLAKYKGNWEATAHTKPDCAQIPN